MNLTQIRILSALNKTTQTHSLSTICSLSKKCFQLHFGFLCGQGQFLMMFLDHLHIRATTSDFIRKPHLPSVEKSYLMALLPLS